MAGAGGSGNDNVPAPEVPYDSKKMLKAFVDKGIPELVDLGEALKLMEQVFMEVTQLTDEDFVKIQSELAYAAADPTIIYQQLMGYVKKNLVTARQLLICLQVLHTRGTNVDRINGKTNNTETYRIFRAVCQQIHICKTGTKGITPRTITLPRMAVALPALDTYVALKTENKALPGASLVRRLLGCQQLGAWLGYLANNVVDSDISRAMCAFIFMANAGAKFSMNKWMVSVSKTDDQRRRVISYGDGLRMLDAQMKFGPVVFNSTYHNILVDPLEDINKFKELLTELVAMEWMPDAEFEVYLDTFLSNLPMERRPRMAANIFCFLGETNRNYFKKYFENKDFVDEVGLPSGTKMKSVQAVTLSKCVDDLVAKCDNHSFKLNPVDE